MSIARVEFHWLKLEIGPKLTHPLFFTETYSIILNDEFMEDTKNRNLRRFLLNTWFWLSPFCHFMDTFISSQKREAKQHLNIYIQTIRKSTPLIKPSSWLLIPGTCLFIGNPVKMPCSVAWSHRHDPNRSRMVLSPLNMIYLIRLPFGTTLGWQECHFFMHDHMHNVFFI